MRRPLLPAVTGDLLVDRHLGLPTWTASGAAVQLNDLRPSADSFVTGLRIVVAGAGRLGVVGGVVARVALGPHDPLVPVGGFGEERRREVPAA